MEKYIQLRCTQHRRSFLYARRRGLRDREDLMPEEIAGAVGLSEGNIIDALFVAWQVR
jgi:hypothetical protein